jgi:NAD+ kinase
MADQPLKIIILAQDPRQHVQQAWLKLEPFLANQKGIEIVDAFVNHDPKPADIDADLAIVLGGDGAMLRSCRMFGLHQMPFVGINLGRLGFLADSSMADFERDFSQYVHRRYEIVHHLMFCCTLISDHKREELVGLNEVAVCSGSNLGMIDVELSINGEHVTTYSGDGLLISTPVGSTAHNLSAGGPILRQSMQAFVVTPICPHTLTVRPIVDDAERLYRLSVPHLNPQNTASLVVDGQITRTIQPGDLIEVRKAPVTFQLARLHSHSFYGTLHRKLGWGGQPRYRE